MRNLKNPEKKLYFKILLHICAIIVISSCILLLVQTLNVKEAAYRTEMDSIVNIYNAKIMKKDSLNRVLIIEQRKLEAEVDSLENIKGVVIKDYGKKINYIYDAPAADHAMWMDSVLSKVNDIKR